MKAPSPARNLSLFARRALLGSFGLVMLTTSSWAIQFANGELKGAFDTTLSFGGLYRLKDPNPDFYGLTNSFNGVLGHQQSVNTDDGNLNYGKGWASELFKGSH